MNIEADKKKIETNFIGSILLYVDKFIEVNNY